MKNKLIVTKLPWKDREITLAAFQREDRIEEIRAWSGEEESILDNIYLGQVERVQPSMNCAFVQINPQTSCYMPLADQEAAFIPHAQEKKELKGMMQLPVQVTKEAGRKKNPRVTAAFSLHSPHMVLLRGSQGVGISQKLSAQERSRLKALTAEFTLAENTGLILRTSAAKAENEQLRAEYDALKERYLHILHLAECRPVFSLLEKAEDPCMAMIREVSPNTPLTIRTDLPEIRDGLMAQAAKEEDSSPWEISFYEDPLLPLYKLYRLETILEGALQEKVWLKSGGFLVIQQTDAFVSVDVNSGKYSSKKKEHQKLYKKINLEAAEEILHQLRLRNLSGMILVDFINMKQPEDQEELLEYLRTLAAKDPVPVTVIDMTPLGIVEITRKKVRKPLAEQLSC